VETVTVVNTKEPDREKCQTVAVLSELYECLAEQGTNCNFATSFGYGHFCQHPHCKAFSE
jgi:hypothetical protein